MEINLSQNDYEVRQGKKQSILSRLFKKIEYFSLKKGGVHLIIGISVFSYFILDIFLLTQPQAQSEIIKWGANFFGVFPIDYYRFITSLFLHGGFFHILFNMVSAYYLSNILSNAWDNRKVFITFFLSGLFANILSFIVRVILDKKAVSIGASGGVFGLMGALMAFFVYSKTLSPQVKKVYLSHFKSLLVVNLIIGILPGLNIDLLSHINGFLSGFMIGFIIEKLPYSFYKGKDGFWTILWFSCVFLIFVSFIWATMSYWSVDFL